MSHGYTDMPRLERGHIGPAINSHRNDIAVGIEYLDEMQFLLQGDARR